MEGHLKAACSKSLHNSRCHTSRCSPFLTRPQEPYSRADGLRRRRYGSSHFVEGRVGLEDDGATEIDNLDVGGDVRLFEENILRLEVTREIHEMISDTDAQFSACGNIGLQTRLDS